MRALLCEAHGPPETLVLRDIAVPEPAQGEVRIVVRAAGLNFPDALMIQNLYQRQPALPFAPGGEVAGIVDAVGDGVTHVKPGDRVAAYALSGGFAEQILLAADRVVPLGEAMDFDTGAALLMTYGTAYHALVQRGALVAGETVLILGAAGGVGLAAVEIAKALGAQVIAAASSPARLALTREHGADAVIDYATEDLKASVKRITGGRGADIVVDPVGGRFADPAFRAIAIYGRYLVIGFAGGDIPAIPLNLPLLKTAAIVGVAWGAFAAREPEGYRANAAILSAMFAEGKLRPHISLRLPLERGGEAIRLMMDRKVAGKIIINP